MTLYIGRLCRLNMGFKKKKHGKYLLVVVGIGCIDEDCTCFIWYTDCVKKIPKHVDKYAMISLMTTILFSE